MKKIFVTAATLLVAVGLIVGPAGAAKKAKKPVPTTFYLHGTEVVGESESFTLVADTLLPMDTTEPTGAEPKSKFITNYLGGPNTMCAGNNLFPVWRGEIAGTIKGDMKFTFHTVGTPGPVEVRVWPDVSSSMCSTDNPASPSDAYPDPAGAVTVDLPAGPGTTEAVIKGVNFKAAGSIIVQVSPVVAVDIPSPGGAILTPLISRILYDTPEFASSLEFSCIPASGKSCTP
jgi:hypothetical protein